MRGPYLFARVVLIMLLTTVARAQVWDVSTDFSAAANPAGTWTYGSKTNLASPPEVYTDTTGVFARYGSNQLAGWSRPQGTLPYVLKNISATDWNYNGVPNGGGGLVLKSGGVLVHPDAASGRWTEVQWTAPTPGTFSVNVDFDRIEQFQGRNADYNVLLNGSALPGGTGLITGFGLPGSHASFINSSLQLSQGDRLEFVIGQGIDGTSDTDAILLCATITTVPEPTVL